MTHTPTRRAFARTSTTLAAVWLALGTSACEQAPVVRNCDFDAAVPCPNLNAPEGRIEGTILYQGPRPPLSQLPGREMGAAGRVILLLFDANNPPPPDGTATTAVSFQTVSAATLFDNAQALPDGTVRASIPYVFPGITRAGVYQIRAFYSHLDEVSYDPGTGAPPTVAPSGFDPLFSVRNEPVLGDVGGGAIVDPNAAQPVFTNIVVGVPVGFDDAGATAYTLPDDGYVTSNVTVFIGRAFPTERPMFHQDTDMSLAPVGFMQTAVPAPPTPIDATTHLPTPGLALVDYAHTTGLLPPGSPQLTIPRNYVVQQPTSGADLPSFSIATGLPMSDMPGTVLDECEIAARGGVLCPTMPHTTIGFFESAFDRNHDGMITFGPTGATPFADAHPTLITANPLAAPLGGRLPWIYPLVIFSKLHDPTFAEEQLLAAGTNGTIAPADYQRLVTSLNAPETLDPANGRFPVFMFGTVVPMNNAALLLLRPWARGFSTQEDPVRIALVPIAIEVHGPNPATDWWAILPPAVPEALRAAEPYLPSHYCCFDYDPAWDTMGGPDFPDQAGVPTGRWSVTLVNQAGQTWSVPNELSNVPGTDCTGGVCSAVSQSLVVRTVAATEPAVPVFCPVPEEANGGCSHSP